MITLRDRTAATIEKQPVTVHREQEFVFTQEGRPTGGALERFRDLLLALPACRTMSWKAVSRAEDFRRWIEDVFGDSELGAAILDLQGRLERTRSPRARHRRALQWAADMSRHDRWSESLEISQTPGGSSNEVIRNFDALATLEQWVEPGRAPDQMVATKHANDSRPLKRCTRGVQELFPGRICAGPN